jgi:hypothetical protein
VAHPRPLPLCLSSQVLNTYSINKRRIMDNSDTEILDSDIWKISSPSIHDLKKNQDYIEEHTRKLKLYKSIEKQIHEQRARIKRYTGLARGSQNFMEQQEILEDLERKRKEIDNNLYKSAPSFWRIKKNISFANKPKGGTRRRSHLRRDTARRVATRRRALR